MPLAKFTALQQIQFPNGTAMRPRRLNGHTVVDDKGKTIEEEYTVVAQIRTGQTFLFDDADPEISRLIGREALRPADPEARVTYTFAHQKDAEPQAKTPRRAGKGAAKAAVADAEGDIL